MRTISFFISLFIASGFLGAVDVSAKDYGMGYGCGSPRVRVFVPDTPIWISRVKNVRPGLQIKDGYGRTLRCIDYPPGPLSPELLEIPLGPLSPSLIEN
ncbi:hypothetical protein [Bradyrhizobium ottawaense]|uniref:hypothetical protein n=1 Tax=Bradyrhizobium ottawaense TaxID=931866 RepID=UPI0030F3D4F4